MVLLSCRAIGRFPSLVSLLFTRAAKATLRACDAPRRIARKPSMIGAIADSPDSRRRTRSSRGADQQPFHFSDHALASSAGRSARTGIIDRALTGTAWHRRIRPASDLAALQDG